MLVELVLAPEGSGLVELVLALVNHFCACRGNCTAAALGSAMFLDSANSLLAGKIRVPGVSRRVPHFLLRAGKLRVKTLRVSYMQM